MTYLLKWVVIGMHPFDGFEQSVTFLFRGIETRERWHTRAIAKNYLLILILYILSRAPGPSAMRAAVCKVRFFATRR